MMDSVLPRTDQTAAPLRAPRCGCGHSLVAWGEGSSLAWCDTPGDLTAYRRRQSTRHDVYGPDQIRLSQGACQPSTAPM